MNRDPVSHACALFERAVQAREHGRLGQAHAWGHRALVMLEQAEGRGHPDVANVLMHLAGTAEAGEDYVTAERHYRRAVRIMQRCASPAVGRGSRSTERSADELALLRLLIQAWSGWGNYLRTMGRYAQAEPALKQALMLSESVFGPMDLEVASPLNNLGVLYKFSGRFPQGERVYRRALAIVEMRASGGRAANATPLQMPRRRVARADRERQALLATLYHNLGGLEHSRGRFAKGEPFARRSVQLREQLLGRDHPAVAEDVGALAALLDGQGNYDEAEQLYARALRIFKRVHGSCCYDVAVTLNNLAAVAQARCRYAKAEGFYRRALDIKEKLLGRRHPDTALTLHNLAVLYGKTKRTSRGRALARRALAIFEEKLGRRHPHTRAARENCFPT